MQAGVRQLHKRGYAVSSVDSIVEAAGVPKGSFFNHFRSKEEFAGEALSAYFHQWIVECEAVINRTDTTGKEKLIALLAIATSKAAGNYEGCFVGNMALELAHQSEALRLQLVKIFDVWSDSFERAIVEGQQDGTLDTSLSPGTMARFIVNLFQGSALRAKVERSTRAAEEFELMVLSAINPN
ncbi:Transcriptional regulator, TetR family [Granulicella sibirica]|uniref:Transcriptional regulator, TetR family n=1 Tax=Granulicella sibirica TaxID=2479048 RepID=A0A4Q0T589_9BACT|nr:Transcriptional regulator, TetR family [Granulicella sibirica]